MMKKINILLILIMTAVFIIMPMFYSCVSGTPCGCSKYWGCRIVTIEERGNKKIIETKTFCNSQKSFYDFTGSVEQTISDSIQLIYQKYKNNPNVTITTRDSIYKYDKIDNLSDEESKTYTKEGYYCGCAG